MNNTYTLQQALKLEKCPGCGCSLQNEENHSNLIFWSDPTKDSITHYQCPDCKVSFQREIIELKRISL